MKLKITNLKYILELKDIIKLTSKLIKIKMINNHKDNKKKILKKLKPLKIKKRDKPN